MKERERWEQEERRRKDRKRMSLSVSLCLSLSLSVSLCLSLCLSLFLTHTHTHTHTHASAWPHLLQMPMMLLLLHPLTLFPTQLSFCVSLILGLSSLHFSSQKSMKIQRGNISRLSIINIFFFIQKLTSTTLQLQSTTRSLPRPTLFAIRRGIDRTLSIMRSGSHRRGGCCGISICCEGKKMNKKKNVWFIRKFMSDKKKGGEGKGRNRGGAKMARSEREKENEGDR